MERQDTNQEIIAITVEETETESLDDLAVENDEQVKGGPGSGNWFNHNETTVEDNSSELNDLTVNADAEIVGGPLKRIRIGGMSFGEEGAE
ncbi:MAG: hypothetical protein SF097_21225 [Acidobacteriota bacterium]|nr:hypothetical protein [Acidobacteriota bacterium]